MKRSETLVSPQNLRSAAVPLLAALLIAAYAAGRLLPALGEGGHHAVRWWGAIAIYLVSAALCLARARRVEEDRRAWTLIGFGLVSYALGSMTGVLSSRPPDDPPAISYVCWIAFYLSLYVALLAMLRARLRPFTLSFCLDGVLGGLTVAALCAALVPHDLDGVSAAKAIAGLTFPCSELVLLSLLLWAGAMTGWRGETWRWLAFAMAVGATGDIVQEVSIVRGTFDDLAPVTACFPVALLAIGVAAWRPAPPVRALRIDALSVLALPLACVVVVVGVLVFGDADDPITGGLAIAALAVAFARAGLTFREVGQMHEGRRFARGFEEAAIGMAFVSTTDLTWTRVNATLAAMLGRTPEDLVGRHIGEIVHASEEPAAHELHRLLRARETPEPYIRRAVRPDGTVVDLAVSAVMVDGDDGTPLLFSQVQDVTEARRIARHNVALADLSRVALESHDAGELVARVTDLLRAALPADTVALLDAPGGRVGEVPDADRALGVPVERRGAPATLLARRTPAQPPFNAAHARFLEAAANVLGTALDRATVEDELRTQALDDPLTGLANRSYLAAHVEQAIAAADRGEALALLFLDLDRFKVVNDSLGHDAGDQLLRARRRRGCATRSARGDTVGALRRRRVRRSLCEDIGGAPQAVAALTPRLPRRSPRRSCVDGRRAVRRRQRRDRRRRRDPRRDRRVAAARRRRRDVPRQGARRRRATRSSTTGMRARAVRPPAQIENELRRALERDELRLHYQPIVDLRRRRSAGLRGARALGAPRARARRRPTSSSASPRRPA